MATVCLSLFGRSPKHLRLKIATSLFELISYKPRLGVGLKVIPTQFYKEQRIGYFYEISKVSPPKHNRDLGRVYGYKTFEGVKSTKEQVLPTYVFKYWHLYEPKK